MPSIRDLKRLLKDFKEVHKCRLTGMGKKECEELVYVILEDILVYLQHLTEEKLRRRSRIPKHVLLKGAGFGDFLSKIYQKGTAFAKKVAEKLKQLAPHFKSVFQFVGNLWRAKNCGGLARPLEYGELHYGCHNYTGPGTRLDLHPDVKPYNDIDACSKKHDEDYAKASVATDPLEYARLIRKADEDAISCYDRFPKEDGYEAARAGIKGKLDAEQLLSLYKGKPSVFYGGCSCSCVGCS
jgi:hypothetical protein